MNTRILRGHFRAAVFTHVDVRRREKSIVRSFVLSFVRSNKKITRYLFYRQNYRVKLGIIFVYLVKLLLVYSLVYHTVLSMTNNTFWQA